MALTSFRVYFGRQLGLFYRVSQRPRTAMHIAGLVTALVQQFPLHSNSIIYNR